MTQSIDTPLNLYNFGFHFNVSMRTSLTIPDCLCQNTIQIKCECLLIKISPHLSASFRIAMGNYNSRTSMNEEAFMFPENFPQQPAYMVLIMIVRYVSRAPRFSIMRCHFSNLTRRQCTWHILNENSAHYQPLSMDRWPPPERLFS